jgi:putative colanic acid biosynthesis acetyltransferase WcaF
MTQKLKYFKMPYGFRGRNAIVVQLWWLVQSTLFSCSPQFLYGWRNFLLKLFGAKIGEGVIIRPSVRITYPWKVKIDDYSWIGDEVTLYSLGNIHIGKNSVISQKSYLCAGSHDYLSECFKILSKDIYIGDGCWLATDVFIAPGVTVGNDCLVGARSSVFSDLEKNYIYFGNPACKIKRRFI